MKKILLLLFINIFFSTSKAQNTFEKVIDTLGSQYASTIQQTFDGGYIFCGSSSYNSNDVMVTKLDSVGNIQWAKIYTGAGVESGVSMQQLADSGYLVSAFVDGGITGTNWLLSLNQQGYTLWTKSFSAGINGGTNANAMAINDAGVIALTGYFHPNTSDPEKGYLILANPSGGLMASKQFNTDPLGNTINAIDNTINNNFILAGSIGSLSPAYSDFYLIRTNSLGDTLWTKTIDYSIYETALSVEQCIDSGFVVAGATYSTTFPMYNACLFKTDLNGDTLWIKRYFDSLSGSAYSVQQTNDEGYIICGVIKNATGPDGNVLLIKTNIYGDTIWTRQFGGAQPDIGYYVRQTSDGGYIICGNTSSFGIGGTYIIKTDSIGNVITATNEITQSFSFKVDPNPNNGIFSVSLSGKSLSYDNILEIYDLTGKQVFHSSIKNNNSIQINTSALPSGMYMVLLRKQQKVYSQKIIIQK